MSRNYRSIAEPKTLNGDVSNSATQITLNNVTGLPSPPYVLVINPDTASEEAVLVTTNQDGVTAPTLKVERAIETGATAKTHTNTNVVRHMIVGSDLQLVHDHLDNTTTAHGATGAVVGTTNTQTLTN
jgi:cytochrome c